MKFRLPIALLVLATAAIQAEGAEKYYRFGLGRYTTSGKTYYANTTDIGMYYNDTTTPDSAAPQTIVFGGPERIDTAYDYPFDGGGTYAFKVGEPSKMPYFAVTENPIKVDRTMVVREGTLLLDGAHIQNHTKMDDAVSNLMVGGQGAHMVLDNGASYTQRIEYAQNCTSAIAIGSGDGKGKVTLNNKSLLHTDHYIFAGYRSIANGYVSWTERDGSGDAQGVRYADANTPGFNDRDEIYINSGSTMSAGTSLQFANVDVYIDGAGSELKDNARGLQNEKSWSWLGAADGSETSINVTNGGSLNIQHNLLTGNGNGSTTNISASGQGSTIKLAGKSYLSYYDKGTSTKIQLSDGAKAEVAYVVSGSGATITVGEGSSMVAHDNVFPEEGNAPLLWMMQGSTIENSGTIGVDVILGGGTYTGDGNADQFSGQVFTMLNGAVVEGLTMTSGTVNISGEVSLTNVTFGTIINAAELMSLSGETDALTVYIQQGAVINADDLNLGTGTNVAVVLNEGVIYEEGMELFTLAGSDSAQVSELATTLGTNLDVYEYGNTGGEGTVVENATGSITTEIVPEPATATLSLLALAGLAMRRRRR